MSVKIGIHGQTTAYSPVWAELARDRDMKVVILDAHTAGFLDDVRSCDAFLWHMNHLDERDVRFGPGMAQALEETGLRVFPNAATARSFDDKLAQARLFAAAGVPAPHSWCFLDAREAHNFADRAAYPLVFKLRGGAGSGNVRKVCSAREAHGLIRQMFGRGMRASAVGLAAVASTGRAAGYTRRSAGEWVAAAGRALRRTIRPHREHGYALFQEFMPGCDHDWRVVVIGERAFAYRRSVRPDDFRASGSGLIDIPDASRIPWDIVDQAFSLSRHWGFQAMAFDFLRHPDWGLKVIEMCYVFGTVGLHMCPGYFQPDGTWVAGQFHPEELIFNDLVATLS